MTRKPVSWDRYLPQTLRALTSGGALLVGQGTDGRANPMTIGWGTVGVVWRKPTLVVLVRPSRYTYSLMEQNADFTVCVLPPAMGDVLAHCGTVSGRDEDKFASQGLTPVPASKVSAPTIDEAVIAYECRTVHRNDLAPETIAPDIVASLYPEGDFHRCYYGHILAVQATDNVSEVLA